jgi:outer membrane protein
MLMIRLVCWLLTASLAVVLACGPVAAQSANGSDALVAGTILLRGRVVGVLTEHDSLTITRIGGYLNTANSVTPEVDLSYFFTDHIALEGETGLLHTTLTAQNTLLGNIPVGKVSSVPIFLIPQFHFLPFNRINPYIGAGLAAVPYFGADPAGGPTYELNVSSEVGAVFQWGLDYRVTGPWYVNFDVKKVILAAHASVNDGEFSASGQVNPWIIGGGIGFRF